MKFNEPAAPEAQGSTYRFMRRFGAAQCEILATFRNINQVLSQGVFYELRRGGILVGVIYINSDSWLERVDE